MFFEMCFPDRLLLSPRVLRFWNNEVLGNLEGVYHTLAKVLHEIDAGR